MSPRARRESVRVAREEGRLPGALVVWLLDGVAQEPGYPEAFQVNNGPEFISRAVDQWGREGIP